MKPFTIPVPHFDRDGLIRELDEESKVCPQVTFSTSRGEHVFDPAIGRQLLHDMLPAVQAVWPDPIVPSHTYARKAFHGTEMPIHKDREGLDCSVTINVSRDAPWDLEVCYDGHWHSYAMDDIMSGLVYEGRELEHRRKPYEGQVAYQLFLHYKKVEEDMNTARVVRIEKVLMPREAESVAKWIEGARQRGLNPGGNGNSDFDDRSVPYSFIDDEGVANLATRVRDMVARVGAAAWGHAQLYPVFTDLVAWDAGSELGWHIDSEFFPERVVTAICGLSDDHVGGETEFEGRNEDDVESINIRVGELVIYPSWVRHRVAPIQSGTRYTIACWATANESMAEFPWGEGPVG